jgi:hypothetical protein
LARLDLCTGRQPLLGQSIVVMRATAQRTTAQDGISYEVRRQLLEDGAETTVYVVRYPAATTSLRVAHFDPPTALDEWCARNRVRKP